MQKMQQFNPSPMKPNNQTQQTQPNPHAAPAWTPGPEEIAAYKLGISEAHHACGMTYDDDPESPRSVAYDWGRNVGEIDATGPANWKALLAAAPEMAEALRDLLALTEALRDHVKHNLNGADLLAPASPRIAKARALLAQIGGAS